jgi:hypothetical protein
MNDLDSILPDTITVPIDDRYLEELQFHAAAAHAMADILWRACQSPQPPSPEIIAEFMPLLVQAHLDALVSDIRGAPWQLRHEARRRAS